MKIFNQKVIAEFTNICPKEVAENVSAIAITLVDESIEEIKKHVPIMHGEHDYIFVDEHHFGTSTVNSELSIFVVFKSHQLEINTKELVNSKFEKFKLRLLNALNSMKKTKKRKKKSKQQDNDNKQILIESTKRYSILNLKNDLVKVMLTKIDNQSYIQVMDYYIKLISPNNLGLSVNIYPVLEESENCYKLYNSYKNEFFEVDFKQRDQNFNQKYHDVGVNFLYMIRVFNNLHFSIFNYIPNQILIESLLFNVPNDLYSGFTFYESFIKILNYLSNTNMKNFVSIVDNTKSLAEEILLEQSLATINKFLSEIEMNL